MQQLELEKKIIDTPTKESVRDWKRKEDNSDIGTSTGELEQMEKMRVIPPCNSYFTKKKKKARAKKQKNFGKNKRMR